MAAASGTLASFAKTGTDACVGQTRRGRRLNSNVMRISRDLFPMKTAHHLSDMTGYSVRACERWLSECVVIPTDALASLLHSEQGRDFLAAVMTDNTPRWWLQLKAWVSAIDYAAVELKQRRKLRDLLDDAQGSASLHVQDPDFYLGQPSPRPAMAPRRKR